MATSVVEPPTETARDIVRRSGSNLAFALAVLPRDRRRDMGVFYAFCRVVDDLADDPGLGDDERRVGLARWRALVRGEVDDPRSGIESEFAELRARCALDPAELEAVLDGVEMDLEPLRFETAEHLKRYCYRVASAVGLVSIRIFGCEDPGARVYAEQLGYALQWTNILRDVGEDAREGRLFLPLEDLRRFGLEESDLLGGAPDLACFQRLMKHEAAVARDFYAAATAALPARDRRALRSAELMRRIYSGILERMETDGFRVFEKRYRLTKARMAAEFLRARIVG